MPTYVDLGPLTRRLDLDSLRLFSVVCTQGSYARAARIEPLTPSAISKRMSDLERTMGCVLLERSSLGVRPTAAGELVLAQWIEMAQALERLTHVADHMSVGGNAQLAVAADADAARFLAFDCLGHTQAQEVAGRVDIARAPLHWLPVEIERRTAQAAVWCLSPGGDGSRATRLASITFDQFRGTRNFRFAAEVCVAVVRRDHALSVRVHLGSADLSQAHVVCAAGVLSPLASGRRGSSAVRPPWSCQVGSTLEYLDSVPARVVALLPTSARHLMHRYPDLRCVPLAEGLGRMDFGCALRDDAVLPERRQLLERLTGCRLIELEPDAVSRTRAPAEAVLS
jgi:DNA-binding transcriptional LysR family regulator